MESRIPWIDMLSIVDIVDMLSLEVQVDLDQRLVSALRPLCA